MCERETIQDQGKSLAPRHQGGRKGGPNFVEQLKQVLFELTHNQGVWLLFLRCFTQASHHIQQRQSAVFTSSVDDTYDAYEKDIAMVSIFFKKDTLHEYRR